MRNTSLLLALTLAAVSLPAQAQISFAGTDKPVWETVPAKSTGLDKVYVLHSTQGVSMSYTASGQGTVKWMSYGDRGGGYAQEITSGITTSGNVSTLQQVTGDKGYIIEQGTDRYYVWVADYSQHRLTLTGISPDESASDCGTISLKVQGSGNDFGYYTINGVHQYFDRQITVAYSTLSWNDASTQWQSVDTTDVDDVFKSTIVVPAPLCNTVFTITGDQFELFWDEQQRVESDYYTTHAVDSRCVVTQEERTNDNEKGLNDSSDGTLGGSAPAHITFTAYCTDAVVHQEWQQSSDVDFDNITLRLDGAEADQTFTEAGTYYWRFYGANDDGSCETYSDTYTVSIGESELVCPNAFSPGTSEGVNDVWKVSFKSIIDFHCWIYNTWGNQIIELNDPGQGWDGTYKGKLVDPGVYYYVIRATGSDGKKYKLSGDINIIRYHKRDSGETGSSSTTDDGE